MPKRKANQNRLHAYDGNPREFSQPPLDYLVFTLTMLKVYNSLFGAARRFVPMLTEQQWDLLIEMYHGMNEDDSSYKCPYQPGDFSFHAYHMTTPDADSVAYSIYRIDMPEPEASPLCRRIYIGLIKEQHKVAYYTIERDPQNNSAICGWDGSGGHLHYGSAPQTDDQELEQIKSFFSQGLGIGTC